MLTEKQSMTETQLYKELLETDTIEDRAYISMVATDLTYEGKLIWMPGDLVGTLSLPRMLH